MSKKILEDISSCEKTIKELKDNIEKLNEGYYDKDYFQKGIRSYLSKASNVLSKIVKLSNNYLIIKDGRVYFYKELEPLPYDKNDFSDDVRRIINSCNIVISAMSSNGVIVSSLERLASCLLTLYEIYDNLDLYCSNINNKISKTINGFNLEIKSLEELIKSKREEIIKIIQQKEIKKDELRLGASKVNDSYNKTDISIGMFEDGELLNWNCNNGLLLVKSYNNEDLYQFIKTMFLNFIFAFPKANAKILYCSNKKNDEMNRFFIKIKTILDNKLFFNDTSSVTFSESMKLQSVFRDIDSLIYERTTTSIQADCDTVYEYNKKNPEYALSNILIVLNDYPNCYRECKGLENLFENSKNYGIHFLIIQTKSELKKNDYNDEYYDNPSDFASIILEKDNDTFIYKNKKCAFIPINEKNYENLLEKVKEHINSKKNVSFEDIGFGSKLSPSEEVDEYISIPVGKADNHDYSIEFAVSGNDDKPISYFVIGDPRKGKSSLIDSMIFNGCMKYSPDDLNFYLIDFKNGVSSAMYTNNAKMPHIKVVAEHSKQEDAEIILQTIIDEQTRRNAIFIKYNTQNLTDYNKKAEKHLPRIIVVIDEVSVMFKDDSTDGNRTDRLVSQCEIIARQGRSSGIHLVLASQSIENKMNKIIDFINGRICFYTTNDDYITSTLGRDDIKRINQECSEPGMALIKLNKNSNSVKVKFAYYDKKEVEYSCAVNNRWKDYPIDVAVAGDDSTLSYYDFCKKETLYNAIDLEGAAIGQNFYNHKIEYLPFDDYHHSMIILGEQSEIHTSILTSVTMYATKLKSKVKIIDASKERFIYDVFNKYTSIDCYTNEEYLDVLNSAYEEFMIRIKNNRENYEPYFLIINNIHLISDFMYNKEYKREDIAYDEYIPLSMCHKQLEESESELVTGSDTFFKILNSLPLVSNFYICFSLNDVQLLNNASLYDHLARCEYKICHYPYNPSMSNIFDREYNQKLANSCSQGIVLLSKKQNPLQKIRYFNYDNDPQTLKMIDKEIKNDEN